MQSDEGHADLAFPSAADFQFFTLHLADALEEG